MSQKIHIANQLISDIYVIAVPDAAWSLVDIFTGISIDLLTDEIPIIDPVKTFNDLASVLIQLVETEEAVKNKDALRKFFKRGSIQVWGGSYKEVFEKKMWIIDGFKPSFWGALFGARDVTLLMVDSNFTKIAYFNSNSDVSWLAQGDQIFRTKVGHPWDKEPKGTVHQWKTSKLARV